MKKAMLASVLGLSLSAAWAVDWDSDDDFVILSDDGTVVGQGELDDDSLDLEMLSGYTGFIRFDAGGEIVEGMVNADGTITLIHPSGLVELDDDLSAKGYGLVVTPIDSVAAPAGIAVTPTGPNHDDGTSDDDADDNGSNNGSSGDDGSSGSDDTDDNSSSSGSTDTSSNDDSDDDDGGDDDGDDN